MAYLAVRERIMARFEHASLAEFPLAMVLFASAAWHGLRVRTRPVPERPWARHVQRVRHLPDPEWARTASPLMSWLDQGRDHEAAARVVAQATGEPAQEVLERLRGAETRRKRLALLKRFANRKEGA